MKLKFFFIAIFCAVFLMMMPGSRASVYAEDFSRTFVDASQNYENGQFEKAAECFLQIAEGGVRNGKLYYNIGNAYFKSGDIGRSILWYEKAKVLRPNDPELLFNLDHTRTFVIDKAPEQSTVLRAFFFWRDIISQQSFIWTAIVFNALFVVCLLWKIILKRSLPPVILYGVFFVFIFSAATAGFNMAADYFFVKGVVLSESVSVKSGFSDLSTELFVLHEGTKVSVETESKDYYRIRFGEDKIGWVRRDVIGVI